MKKYERLFQIGEVARLYGISRKMLLNYEKRGLIKPSLVDKYTGYRYFDVIAISKVGLILELRRTGMSINDIGKYLSGKITAEKQISRLQEQLKTIERSIEQLQIRNVNKNSVSEITDTILPAVSCVCRNCVAATVDSAIAQFFEFYETCFEKDYFSKDSLLICEFNSDLFAEDFFRTENIDMRFCISVNPEVCKKQLYVFPKTRALSITFCGAIEESYIAYEKLKRYVTDHNLTVVGYPREYYLEGEPYGNYEANITRITVPIAMD